MEYDQLKLKNQLCFPVYAASRLITREYQPYLDELGITYPQYLVLMVLWERDGITVNEISGKLILNTNTITPLLKRMETMKILKRKRARNDSRKVNIFLTQKGENLKLKAVKIPCKLVEGINSYNINRDELLNLKKTLHRLIDILISKEKD